jgi:hypothetical protein
MAEKAPSRGNGQDAHSPAIVAVLTPRKDQARKEKSGLSQKSVRSGLLIHRKAKARLRRQN